jgi:hypothetical protein
MPQFDLADEDITRLMVFLRGRTEAKIKESYRYSRTSSQSVVDGQRLAARYNCTGCHIIAGRGGDVRRLYEKNLTEAPPNLLGEGRKVQAPWLYNFIKAPSPIRPWLSIRMPTFSLSDEETYTAVHYFAGSTWSSRLHVHQRRDYVGSNVEAGRTLASQDYLSCFSCHVRAASFPRARRTAGRPTWRWRPAAAAGVDHRLAPRPAEAAARHQDAELLRRSGQSGRSARHPEWQRRRPDPRAARLRDLDRARAIRTLTHPSDAC